MSEQPSSTADGVRVPGFTVVRRIGIGGFATVYEAVQEDVGAPVALKVLALDHAEDRVRNRFERECRTMGTLRGQRGIVPVYQAAYSTDGRPVIVMALMPGGSLLERVERRGPLPVNEVIDVGVTTAMALQAAHDRGIHHRDVKPENVLLDQDGGPGLSDFGIASIGDLSPSTRTAASLSPPHAPPERFLARGDSDLTAGDIYSLGSTLYQLLAGDPPFGTADDGGLAALLDRVLNGDVPPIARDDVSDELMAVLTRSMAKDPGDRYRSARDLAQALDRCRTKSGDRPPSVTTGTLLPDPTRTPVPGANETVTLADAPARPTGMSESDAVDRGPGSTRMIGPDPSRSAGTGAHDRRASTEGQSKRRVRSRRVTFVTVLCAVLILALVAVAGLVIADDLSARSATPSEPNQSTAPLVAIWTTTESGFLLRWYPKSSDPSSAMVGYCKSRSTVSTPVACISPVETLDSANPSRWTRVSSLSYSSPAITRSNSGRWNPGTNYCFAIVNRTTKAYLSKWACATAG